MDSYSEGLVQKRLKMQSLLALTQQLNEAANNGDLAKIDHLMNERQVLMSDVDALDRMLSQLGRPDRNIEKAADLLDAIVKILRQIRIIDEDTQEILNQGKNAVQQQILAFQQERKKTGSSKFLNVKI